MTNQKSSGNAAVQQGVLEDDGWCCRLPAVALNEVAREGLCRVAVAGRIYETDDIVSFLQRQMPSPPAFVVAKPKRHACWLVLRVRDWAAVANHGVVPEAADADAEIRNSGS